MAGAYSTDSRSRVLAAVEVHLSPNAVHFTVRMAAAKSIRMVGCGARGRGG
jgi:hypothetical protein